MTNSSAITQPAPAADDQLSAADLDHVGGGIQTADNSKLADVYMHVPRGS